MTTTTEEIGNTRTTVVEQANEAIQKELDVMMEMLEEIQDKIPEGAYLRGMNALGALHKHKRTTLGQRRPGDMLRVWLTLEEIEEFFLRMSKVSGDAAAGDNTAGEKTEENYKLSPAI